VEAEEEALQAVALETDPDAALDSLFLGDEDDEYARMARLAEEGSEALDEDEEIDAEA
jgi:hypothetical protein